VGLTLRNQQQRDGAPGDGCRLCRNRSAVLKDSHIIPKWAWRVSRTRGAANPEAVTVEDGVAYQTSHQIVEKLLCADCEERFSVFEGYVRSLVYTDGTSAPIFDKAETQPIVRRTDTGEEARYLPLDNVDVDKIARFAISVFWRSHVAKRDNAGQVDLGATHGEHFRQFLLGRRAFPSSSALLLSLLAPDDEEGACFNRTVCVPITNRDTVGVRHEFIICGFIFELHTGINSWTKKSRWLRDTACLMRHGRRLAALMPAKDSRLIRVVHAQVKTAEVRVKGMYSNRTRAGTVPRKLR